MPEAVKTLPRVLEWVIDREEWKVEGAGVVVSVKCVV
jgi:hypothetical protein